MLDNFLWGKISSTTSEMHGMEIRPGNCEILSADVETSS